MAKSKLEIFVTAQTDKAVAALKKLDKATEDVGDQSKDTGGKLGILDGAMLAAGGMAVNMAMNFAKSIPELVELGVQAERAELALKGYAGGSEAAAEYTDAVRDAAGGAISKMDAMQNASRLLAMGLATSTDEAATLTEMAITLGASMGKGPTQAFEEFSLMLANQSIPRLDTFGISASKVRERMAELAEEDGNLDRQTRFLIATMEIGEGKLEKLAEAGFNAVSSLDQLKAIMADAKVEGASLLWDAVEPLTKGILELRDAQLDEKQTMLETAVTFDEYYEALGKMETGLMGAGGANEDLARATWEVYQASLDTTNAAYDLHEAYRQGRIVFEEAEVAVRDYKDELGDLADAVSGKVGQAFDAFKEKQLGLREAILETEGEISTFNTKQMLTPEQLEQLNEAVARIDEQKAALIRLEKEYDIQTQKMVFNMMAQKLAASDLAPDVQLAFLTTLAGELDIIDDRTVATTLGVNQAVITLMSGIEGASEKAQAELDGVIARIDSIPAWKQVDIIVNFRQIGGNLARLTGGYGYQHGGSFIVGGQGVDQTPVSFMATRGEKVDITPSGEAKNSGGWTGDFIYAPGFSLGSREEFETVIAPMLRDAVR